MKVYQLKIVFLSLDFHIKLYFKNWSQEGIEWTHYHDFQIPISFRACFAMRILLFIKSQILILLSKVNLFIISANF
jgi:hypothetical protein